MKLEAAELLRLEERLARGELPEDAHPVLLEALRHLIRCRYRRGASTATTERRRKRRNSTEKKKGHGRNGADDYPSAEPIAVAHPDLKAGGPCPEPLCRGKLYDTTAPNKDVELKASPPIQATVYERQVLRCASCQKTFTAPLPPQAHGAKYHPSVDAVLSVMRYSLGMPHHRLAQWQRWAGVPLSASTQFGRVEAMANAVFPVFRHMETMAANRPLVQSDDTGARILELMAENKTRAPDERTGIFTTGVVARSLDGSLPTIVLYSSGRRHAGENLDQLLMKRSEDAGKVIHMADASSMAPSSSRRITANCMAHMRRYFIEAYAAFPEHCERVLEDIATIYQHDDKTCDMDPPARLAYHQEHSQPVMKALYDWIEKQFLERLVEPNSRLGKAFSYVKNHWQGLNRFLEVPGVPLDNNETERELKPSQRHRKNSLFFKTHAGAVVGDVLLSMIRTCVTNAIDPVHYLSTIATHAAKTRLSPESWLPWTYRKTLERLN
ncbi:MAG: IS66 family transposase [Vicinamibacteria bacterium]